MGRGGKELKATFGAFLTIALFAGTAANAEGIFSSIGASKSSGEGAISQSSAQREVRLNRTVSNEAASVSTQNSSRNTNTRPSVVAPRTPAITAAAPNKAAPTIVATSTAPRRAPSTTSSQTNSPANIGAQAVPKPSESAVKYATEAEMALALNMPLEPKNAQDARFETSDMRPQDVAPWQKIGAPYQVNGVWYIPAHEPNYDETGEASWYGSQFNGRATANGEIFDMTQVTVAHPTLPIPSLVEITNLENGRSVVARVNDRGPFASNRLVDVSQRAAELLGFKEKGRARVRVRYVGQAPQAPINTQTARPVIQANTTPLVQTANKPEAAKPTIIASAPVIAPVSAAPTTPANINGAQETYIQIGAFASLANAERALDSNSRFGAGRIVPVQSANGNIYRVYIGPFNNSDALTKVEEAKQNGISGARLVANIS